MDQTDDQLVAAYVRQGDARAFRLLVERHQERVFGYLLGMTRDVDSANDLFQDTFIRVIAALRNDGGYRAEGQFRSWVLRIARNTAIDYLRRRRLWSRVEGDGLDGEGPIELAICDAPDALARVEDAEAASVLESLISRLPREQREVLLLRHHGDLTFREIAELTGCSINTALGRMRYALLNLRRMIAEASEREFAGMK